MNEAPIGMTEELHVEMVECGSTVAVSRDELSALLERLERSHRLDPYSQLVADLRNAVKAWLNP